MHGSNLSTGLKIKGLATSYVASLTFVRHMARSEMRNAKELQ